MITAWVTHMVAGVDPYTNLFDLGDDPLAYYWDRMALAQACALHTHCMRTACARHVHSVRTACA